MLKHNQNTLVILAAGASSRMRRSLESSPIGLDSFTSKALIPLGAEAKPAVSFLIINAVEAGIQRIILIVPEASEAFQTYFNQQGSGGISIDYAVQKIPSGRQKPMGTADALLQCMDQYPELKETPFLVCNGDNLYSIEAFTDLIQSNYKNALIGYNREGLEFPMERIAAFALLELDEQHRLASIIEKPTPEEVALFKRKDGDLFVSMNIWKFYGEDVYPYLLNCPINPERNEKELPTAVLNMIGTEGVPLYVVLRNEHVPDLTSAEDIEKVSAYLKNKKP